MSTASLSLAKPGMSQKELRQNVEQAIEEIIAPLPDPAGLSAEQGRGIIARYAAVLEGNFIYWMTAAHLAVRSEQARSITEDNLLEEVRDCHPGMMRRFAMAAKAVPTCLDAMAVYPELSEVRLFIGRLSAVPMLAAMAFFEGFIQRFMVFLADLAERQGSAELEYTAVHGVCDIGHTEGLFRALDAEMTINPPEPGVDVLEGVTLIGNLIGVILDPSVSAL